jgi:hypothetical protein
MGELTGPWLFVDYPVEEDKFRDVETTKKLGKDMIDVIMDCANTQVRFMSKDRARYSTYYSYHGRAHAWDVLLRLVTLYHPTPKSVAMIWAKLMEFSVDHPTHKLVQFYWPYYFPKVVPSLKWIILDKMRQDPIFAITASLSGVRLDEDSKGELLAVLDRKR